VELSFGNPLEEGIKIHGMCLASYWKKPVLFHPAARP
jgi:hypothetical protein